MRDKLIDLIHDSDLSLNSVSLADHLLANGVIVPHTRQVADFKVEYGIVSYKHRFSINRSLDDYEETTLDKCIRMSVEHKYKTVACDKLITEMQILHRDKNDEVRCLCLDLKDYTFEIKHKGDMKIVL